MDDLNMYWNYWSLHLSRGTCGFTYGEGIGLEGEGER